MFTLSWQPPYDWSWMLGFLAARAVDGVETVGEGFYARSLVVGEHRGLISVSPHLPTHTVQVSVSAGLLPVAPACLAKVSRLF
ncbi:DNA-3-methyladenine glycosylase 2, partial [Salmonella enterica]|nr:DNA-3-methyladenine glycosylase 2 [Salmonella enterica]